MDYTTDVRMDFIWLHKPTKIQNPTPTITNHLNSIIAKIEEQQAKTLVATPQRIKIERDISAILSKCSVPDWDGYGAEPVDLHSIEYAKKFMDKLPPHISYPELTANPDGDLDMVWIKNGYSLVVAIDKDGQIAWGGTTPDGGGVHGDAQYKHCIPRALTNILERIYK